VIKSPNRVPLGSVGAPARGSVWIDPGEWPMRTDRKAAAHTLPGAATLTFDVSGSVFDRADNTGYYNTPVAAPGGAYVLAPERYRSAAGANWDGTITVIANPTGA
jgi:hypothetical protein